MTSIGISASFRVGSGLTCDYIQLHEGLIVIAEVFEAGWKVVN